MDLQNKTISGMKQVVEKGQISHPAGDFLNHLL